MFPQRCSAVQDNDLGAHEQGATTVVSALLGYTVRMSSKWMWGRWARGQLLRSWGVILHEVGCGVELVEQSACDDHGVEHHDDQVEWI